jgi:hypothetical protein
MGLKWFLQADESVEGPFSADDVKARLENGQISSHHMIWGRGLPTWQRLEWWMRELPRLNTVQHVELDPALWHYAHHGKSHGPFSKEELVQELKNLDSLGEAMLWTKGMKEWAPLFEFHEILNAIGINKRQFPRADIQGNAVIKSAEAALNGSLVSIGEGGCGIVVQNANLVPGQAVTLELQSRAFRDPLHCKAEVRYVSGTIVGMKFSHVSMEAKGAIISYVRQNQTRFVIKSAA